jgi:hypothetical protein
MEFSFYRQLLRLMSPWERPPPRLYGLHTGFPFCDANFAQRKTRTKPLPFFTRTFA